MFLLHPRVGDQLNTQSIYATFGTEGLAGPYGRTLHAQQANRLVAFGHQCLASTGGTGSLCGGAAGPGGGLAGASGAPFSGAAAATAGGSNGAAGGVPAGGQEIGRYSITGAGFSPYMRDDTPEADPRDANNDGPPGPGSDAEEDARKWLVSGMSSVDGTSNNNMYTLAVHYGFKHWSRRGCTTCNQPNNS